MVWETQTCRGQPNIVVKSDCDDTQPFNIPPIWKEEQTCLDQCFILQEASSVLIVSYLWKGQWLSPNMNPSCLRKVWEVCLCMCIWFLGRWLQPPPYRPSPSRLSAFPLSLSFLSPLFLSSPPLLSILLFFLLLGLFSFYSLRFLLSDPVFLSVNRCWISTSRLKFRRVQTDDRILCWKIQVRASFSCFLLDKIGNL